MLLRTPVKASGYATYSKLGHSLATGRSTCGALVPVSVQKPADGAPAADSVDRASRAGFPRRGSKNNTKKWGMRPVGGTAGCIYVCIIAFSFLYSTQMEAGS